MHPIGEQIIRDKYMFKAVQIRMNEALSDVDKQKQIQELAQKMNAELLDVESSGDNILIVFKTRKEDIGKGVAVMNREMAEELGYVEGCPILVKNEGHVIERNVKYDETPELNIIAILLDKDDRSRLGVKEGDTVRICIPTVPDPEAPN